MIRDRTETESNILPPLAPIACLVSAKDELPHITSPTYRSGRPQGTGCSSPSGQRNLLHWCSSDPLMPGYHSQNSRRSPLSSPIYPRSTSCPSSIGSSTNPLAQHSSKDTSRIQSTITGCRCQR